MEINEKSENVTQFERRVHYLQTIIKYLIITDLITYGITNLIKLIIDSFDGQELVFIITEVIFYKKDFNF